MTRRVNVASDTLPMFDVIDNTQPKLAAAIDSRVDDGPGTPHDGQLATRKAISAVPAVIDVETAGRLLGLGRSAAYQLVKDGAWPTPVLRLGRRWRVLTAPLLALLGIEELEASVSGATLQSSPTAPAIFRHDQGDQ